MNLRSRTAGELMHSEVVTISGAVCLREAIRTMKAKRLQALVVPPQRPVDGIGIITVKDIIGVLEGEDTDAEVLDDLTVSDVMTRPSICTQKGLGIHDCVNLMRMTGVHRVPVLAEGKPIGLLSFTDVFRRVSGGDP